MFVLDTDLRPEPRWRLHVPVGFEHLVQHRPANPHELQLGRPPIVPKGGNYFALDYVRLFFTGKVTKVIGFELSTDMSGIGNAASADSTKR